MDIDQVIAQMIADDNEDAPFITPVNYGKLRGIAPQLVYYHIKRGHIPDKTCDCGRKVIDKEEADDYFRSIGKLATLRNTPGEELGADSEGPAEPAT